MRVALLACTLALFPIAAHASIPREPLARRILAMSYNIKGLPGVMTSSEWKSDRFEVIGKLLAAREKKGEAPDVVFLQEGFSDHTAKLIRESGYLHFAQGPEFKTWLGLNSGLYILSRHPIVAKASREFKAYPNCNGIDCFANKGVQFARIQVPGLPRPIDLFNTHLQAGPHEPPARQKQVAILIEFFKEHHDPENPVIFSGDFNLRPLRNQEIFDSFVAGTGLSHSGRHCLDRGCARSLDQGWQGVWENAVDHQFYSTRGEVLLVPMQIERTMSEPVRGLRLSDHSAHEVVFELRYF